MNLLYFKYFMFLFIHSQKKNNTKKNVLIKIDLKKGGKKF